MAPKPSFTGKWSGTRGPPCSSFSHTLCGEIRCVLGSWISFECLWDSDLSSHDNWISVCRHWSQSEVAHTLVTSAFLYFGTIGSIILEPAKGVPCHEVACDSPTIAFISFVVGPEENGGIVALCILVPRSLLAGGTSKSTPWGSVCLIPVLVAGSHPAPSLWS